MNMMKTIQNMSCTCTQRMKRNEVVLNDLPCELYAINANDRIPAAENQKQTNTGGLVNLLKL